MARSVSGAIRPTGRSAATLHHATAAIHTCIMSAFSSTKSTCTTDSCGTNDVRCCTGHERLVCILTMRKLTKTIERWLFITP